MNAKKKEDRPKGVTWKHIADVISTNYEDTFTEDKVRSSFRRVRKKRDDHQKNTGRQAGVVALNNFLSETYKPPYPDEGKKKRQPVNDQMPPSKRLNLDDSFTESQDLALDDVVKENATYKADVERLQTEVKTLKDQLE